MAITSPAGKSDAASIVKPDQAGWYRDGDSLNRLKWWTGNKWHELTKGDYRAKKLPIPVGGTSSPSADTPPGLYPQPQPENRERSQWWDGHDWVSSLDRVLAGFTGQLVMCGRILEVAAVEHDFVALIEPWHTGSNRAFLLPQQHIGYLIGYPTTISVAPYQATVMCTIMPTYLMNAPAPQQNRGGAGVMMGVGGSVPLGGLLDGW